MGFMDFIERAWMPLLIGLVALYFAFRVLVFQDMRMIRSKDKPEPRDKEGYCNAAGKLMILLGAGALLMAVLETISPIASLVEIVICTVAVFVLWKRMSDKYE